MRSVISAAFSVYVIAMLSLITTLSASPLGFTPPALDGLIDLDAAAQTNLAMEGICPDMKISCVKDKKWTSPVGSIGKKPFCREGLRCNQCEEARNTRECNRVFPECERRCDAYAPIPF